MQSGEKFVAGSFYQLALAGDVPGIQSILETEGASNEDLLCEVDDIGRNALLAASMLGRCNVVRELVKQGADVNTCTVRGYSPLHYSALWGQLNTLKTLVELGANTQATNFRGERAKEVAFRYSKMDCVAYLSWAEAKHNLQSYIKSVKETLADPERIQGKFNKEEKKVCSSTCTEKSDWILNSKNPTTEDFCVQRKHMADTLSPIMAKLTVQADASTKVTK